MKKLESKLERRDKGKNVEIVLKFIRHGERDKLGNLEEHGREITKERARESGLEKEEFDAIKAIGSNAGPKGPTGMERSLETADIYAHEIAGDEAFQTRARKILSYETLITKPPYDHVEVYNSFLPEDFDGLSPEEKVDAAKKAQAGIINHFLSLKTPEAEQYRKEIAGAFAVVIDHYQKVAERLDDDSRVLIPAGSHGGTMEVLLQQALVHTGKDGEIRIGFEDLADIGGDIDPSESFDVFVATDENGDRKKMKVTFDNPNRPQGGDMYLDQEKIQELKDFYLDLHKQN